MKRKTVAVFVNGRARTAAVGTALSEVLAMETPCAGHGLCGKCKVRVSGAVSSVSERERALLTENERERGIRLACRTYVEGECRVDLLPTEATETLTLTRGDTPVISLLPAFERYGAAIDLGTTTVAARLYDASGRLLSEEGKENPQIAFGADVISRLEAAKKGSAEPLARRAVRALDEMLEALARGAGIEAYAIDALVITGNTAMLYLLTETDPLPLTRAPFDADRLFGEILRAGELGLRSVNARAEVYLPPCISSFVGADTICALLATELYRRDESSLLVDIGTNGEIALWHGSSLSACSAAAGPAFEGGGITAGMRGSDGAIDAVTLRDGAMTCHVIGDGEPKGICGSGLIDAVACLLETGRLEESGYMEEERTVLSGSVCLTRKDIRMLQLAKSAICAGIRTLLTAEGIEESEVATVYVAGGFGYYLDLENAKRIGLLPSSLIERVRVVGNGALGGASMLLLNRSLRSEALRLAQSARTRDLANSLIFQERYMMGILLTEQ